MSLSSEAVIGFVQRHGNALVINFQDGTTGMYSAELLSSILPDRFSGPPDTREDTQSSGTTSKSVVATDFRESDRQPSVVIG
jgi:hypothetical protein